MNKPLPNVTVTKTEFGLGPADLGSEEVVLEFAVTAPTVKRWARGMMNWIENRKFRGPTDDPATFQLAATPTIFQTTPPERQESPIWFVGDLHGDLVALMALKRFALYQDRQDRTTSPVRVCFLGDFIDDGPYSAEVVAWLMKAMSHQRETDSKPRARSSACEIMAVVGNHDEGLRFIPDGDQGSFGSTVSPSRFSDELNQRMGQVNGGAWKEFGLAAIELFGRLPRMALIDGSVLIAHGGVPHADVVIADRSDLNSPQALSDFVWNRLHETARRKIPNRESRGSQQGIWDIEQFLERLTPIASGKPKFFLRGHDHHNDNFKHYEEYKSCSVMTLNAFTVNRGGFGQKYRNLALLRWRPAEPDRMTLFRLRFREGALDEIWRELRTGHEAQE